jgi:hypothetical protein
MKMMTMMARTVVLGLKVIDQGQDVLMSHRDLLQHCDLVSHLIGVRSCHVDIFRSYHVLSPGHQPLVDDLCRIISPRVDVHAFFHHGVGASAQCFASLVSARLDLGSLPCAGLAGHEEWW